MNVEVPPPRRRLRRRWLVAAVVAVAGGALAIGLFVAQDDPTPGGGGSVAGVVLDGFDHDEPVALASFRGQPLVINYWASWCEPCIKEMPDLQAVHEDVGDRIVFLGVNVMDDVDRAREVADETGVAYLLARDPDADRFRDLDGVGMPTTFFVDAEGVILERFTGPMDEAMLRERIERHFS